MVVPLTEACRGWRRQRPLSIHAPLRVTTFWRCVRTVQRRGFDCHSPAVRHIAEAARAAPLYDSRPRPHPARRAVPHLHGVAAGGGGLHSWSWLPGFTPLAAVALCAGIYLPRRLALVIPLGILLLSDAVIDAHYGARFFSVLTLADYALLAVVGLFGMSLRQPVPRRSRPGRVLAATLAGSSSSTSPATASSGSARPTIRRPLPVCSRRSLSACRSSRRPRTFFRNGLVSDLLYSMVFVACVRLTLPRGERIRSSSPVRTGPGASFAD